MEIDKAVATVRSGRKWLMKILLKFATSLLREWINEHLKVLHERGIIDEYQLQLIDEQIEGDLK